MGFTLLERRGARYYFRQRVPVDLQEHFGRGELRRSLGTADPREARRRLKLEATRAEKTFERMRRDAMTNEQFRKIAEEYLHSTLDYCERLRGEGVVPETDLVLEGNLYALSDRHERYTEALADLGVKETRKRGLKLAEGLVSEVLKDRGLSLDKDTEEYAFFARELLKRAVEVCKVEGERLQGNYQYDRQRLYAPQVVAQSGTTETPKASGPLLSEVIAAYAQEHTVTMKKWTEKTEQENSSILAVFLELIGDRDIDVITHKELMKVRAELVKVPSNPKKGKDREGKSLKTLIAMKLPPMSQSTANKYLIRLASFWKWAVKHEYAAKNVAEGLTLGKPKGRASEARDIYETADIQRMFAALEYDSAVPERFWIPLVGLYSGMRLDEVCQLHLTDVKELEGVPCFSVNEEGNKKVKTQAGKRVVPVHPVLIELGLLEYVRTVQPQGAVQLWPNLKKKRDGYSQDFGKWFQRFNRREVTKDPKKVFHSFRHGVTDCLKQAGVEESLAGELVGHENEKVTYGRYGKNLKPQVLLEMLLKVDFGVDLDAVRVKVPEELRPKA